MRVTAEDSKNYAGAEASIAAALRVRPTKSLPAPATVPALPINREPRALHLRTVPTPDVETSVFTSTKQEGRAVHRIKARRRLLSEVKDAAGSAATSASAALTCTSAVLFVYFATAANLIGVVLGGTATLLLLTVTVFLSNADTR